MLEGRLVRLRAMEPEDLERSLQWANDREVALWRGAPPYPHARSDEMKSLAEVPTNGFGSGVKLAIETRDGKHIGEINLHRTNPEDRKAGLGVVIGEKDCWSNGYGADAVRTLLTLAFDEMNLHRVYLYTFANNEGAIACYLKCGFRKEARLRQDMHRDGRYHDTLMMGVLKEEFASINDEKRE